MCGGNEETGELRRGNCDGGAAAEGGGKRWEAGRWVRRIWPIENPPSVVAGGDVSEMTESVKPGRFHPRMPDKRVTQSKIDVRRVSVTASQETEITTKDAKHTNADDGTSGRKILGRK